MDNNRNNLNKREVFMGHAYVCLLYTSDAADD